jgi:hypothetical protein
MTKSPIDSAADPLLFECHSVGLAEAGCEEEANERATYDLYEMTEQPVITFEGEGADLLTLNADTGVVSIYNINYLALA